MRGFSQEFQPQGILLKKTATLAVKKLTSEPQSSEEINEAKSNEEKKIAQFDSKETKFGRFLLGNSEKTFF